MVLMEGRPKITELRPLLLLLITASCAFQIHASSHNHDLKNAIFYEPFDEPFEDRCWIVSSKDEYKGVWKLSKSEGHDDHGLLVSEKARKYAVVKELEEAVSLKGRTVVLQFEVRLQNGLECGGAYLKYLRPQEAGWKPEEFGNDSPYSIMFGPDKCGSTNRVHFIFKHKNPKSGEYVEHHLKNTPNVPDDKLSHVYTAIVKPDSEVRILVDGEEKKKARFLSAQDFEPPLVPAKTIPDPEDKKPTDWDERPKIPDPDAVKPDDWDEDAPVEILDEEAEKPEGWLDDEPHEIGDPEATKPEDWDDEEDGVWEPPKLNNPKCTLAPGCGEWKRPMKKNPAYKGKWHRPLIKNPGYKGVWKPQQIPNPHYFDTKKPDFEAIAAIGIEIWTMQDGILFENILITDDEKVAESYRRTTWKPKFRVEKERQRAEEAAGGLSFGLSSIQQKIFGVLYKIANVPFLDPYKPKIIDLIEKAEEQPHITLGVIGSIVVILLTVLFKNLLGGKKPVQVAAHEPKGGAAAGTSTDVGRGSDGMKADETEKVNPDETKKETEKEDAAPRKRSTRKET